MLTSFIFIEANYHWNKPIQKHKILSERKLLIKNKYEKIVSVGQSTARTTCHENKDKQQTPIVLQSDSIMIRLEFVCVVIANRLL